MSACDDPARVYLVVAPKPPQTLWCIYEKRDGEAEYRASEISPQAVGLTLDQLNKEMRLNDGDEKPTTQDHHGD